MKTKYEIVIKTAGGNVALVSDSKSAACQYAAQATGNGICGVVYAVDGNVRVPVESWDSDGYSASGRRSW